MMKLISSKRGATSIIFIASFTAMCVLAALSIDIGAVVVDKAKLSATIDASALAGAQELVTNSSDVENIVNSYILKNSSTLKDVKINVDTVSRIVEVTGLKAENSYFASVFNGKIGDITSTAKAKVENISSIKGARPLAIIQQDFIYGKLYTLKEDGGDGTSGNYAAISLGGSGSSIYRDNLMYGYAGTISVGDIIPTETGNIAGATQTSINYLTHGCTHSPECTYQYYNRNCSRIIFIPVVNTLQVNGKKNIKVLGFATFFLEGVTDKGGQAEVTGRFITYSMQGETSSEINDYGTYGIKLVK